MLHSPNLANIVPRGICPTLAVHLEGKSFLPTDPNSWARWPDDAESNLKNKRSMWNSPTYPGRAHYLASLPDQLEIARTSYRFYVAAMSGSSNEANWTTSARASSGRPSPTKTAPALRLFDVHDELRCGLGVWRSYDARCCWRGLTLGCRLSMRRSEVGRVLLNPNIPIFPFMELPKDFGGYGAVGGVF